MAVRRRVVRPVLVAVVSALAVATFVAPSQAASGAYVAAVGHGSKPQLQRDSSWTVVTDASGTIVAWDPRGRRLSGDARPEFALDGEVIGAPVTDPSGRLRLFVPGLSGVTPAHLSVLLSGRRIDVAAPGRAAVARPSASSVTGPVQPRSLVTPDPGTPGTFATTAFTYAMPSITVDGMPVPLEVLGLVVAPVGAQGRRPVVLFLHGRHSTCYLGGEITVDWPCSPGSRAIPSLAGYRRTQQLLASRGYITVSIAANGINAQDGGLPDSGANARSVLVRHHLDLLAAWNTTSPGPGQLAALHGRLDMGNVMLVGHSRGGEGVARAAIDTTVQDPYRIRGEVLIAPTDFGRQVPAGLPTTVLLPYCDGDVSDLQGQQYVDQSRGLISGDNALRTAVMVVGANHNYFNSEWTPGTAKAPANDDWGDSSDSTCGTHAAGRLSPSAQLAVGATYVSAAADSYLRRSATAVRLLDGTQVRAASAGKAVVLTEALGGRRRVVLTDPRAVGLVATGRARVTACAGSTLDGSPSCIFSAPSPHWLQGDLPSTYAMSASWSAPAAVVGVRFATPRNLSTGGSIDLRVIPDPAVSTSTFRVVLADSRGHSVSSAAQFRVTALPGSAMSRKAWAQTVRVPVSAFPGVDLRSVRAIGLRAVSRTGRLVVLDAYLSHHGLSTSSIAPTSVPRFQVSTTAVTLPGDDKVHDVPVTIAVVGTVTRPARLWMSVQGVGGPGKVDAPTKPLADGLTEVTIAPGTTQVSFTIKALGNSVFSSVPDHVQVVVYAARDAQVSGYVGGADVSSDVVAPTISAVATQVSVVQGQPIIWTLKLSAPTRYGWYDQALAVTPATGTELTVGDLLPVWVQGRSFTPTLPDGSPAPLSQASLNLNVSVDMLATTSVLEIPTARTSTSIGDRTVALEIVPDGVVLSQSLRLSAVVHPAP